MPATTDSDSHRLTPEPSTLRVGGATLADTRRCAPGAARAIACLILEPATAAEHAVSRDPSLIRDTVRFRARLAQADAFASARARGDSVW